MSYGMKFVILTGVIIGVIVVVFTSISKFSAITTVNQTAKTNNDLRRLIFNGNSFDAEVAWSELKKRVKRNNLKSKMEWIDFQVELIDKLNRNYAKHGIRRSAMQEFCWDDNLSFKHEKWLRKHLDENFFIDPWMQQKAKEQLAIFDRIIVERKNRDLQSKSAQHQPESAGSEIENKTDDL